MLNPEIWNFKPPQHYFSIEEKDFKKNDIPNIIKSHYFNHSISLILPDTIRIPNELRTCIFEDSDYYRINNLNVSELINKEFIEAFVKKGELTLLTIENNIDLDNSVAITPSGHLILSLLTEDFQKLGLEGKVSFFDRKMHTRYEENVCPSSVAAWFHKRKYSVFLCQQVFLQRTEYSLSIPIISNESDTDKFFEWLGVFSICGDLKNNIENDYVNTYKCPLPSMNVGQVQYLQWTGFFTRNQIKNLYNAMNEYISTKNTLPWTALHVQGFLDSPVSWDLKEHTFYTDGDNSYTIVFRPAAHSIIYKNLSSNNKPRIFQ
ncbi:ribonuclease P protein subunit p40 isoform X2 [Apis cerana]|uniref:ribonuclease P protein subunit p40 isoform X2 n=1 Tax=Apis cerana TaxID=7461 RepID=UPI002B23A37C|nr:ribonuclease P protein subunit p40 isoform X2 [Apis cerana]